jgi:dihydroorotate dehydrogenase (fumarate)
MDISTTYLGLSLPNPFIAGPSPLTNRLDTIKRLEDAGIAAIVFPPLFEEQLQSEQMALSHSIDTPANSFAEALSYFVEPEHSIVDAEAYATRLADVKKHINVPVIGSINAVTPAKWGDYAVLMEQAGADALEVDFYYVANNASESGEEVERRMTAAFRTVKERVRIPVSVKLTPFHTSLAHFARSLEAEGADGLVLLHRFYEPDLDLENLEPLSQFRLSDSRELLLRLRWLAIISGYVKCSLAANGGVHSAEDTVKAVMAGAHCVQLSSALLRNGIGYAKTLREALAMWLHRNEYESLRQMHGTMNIERIPDPKALSREHYMHVIGSMWLQHGEGDG